MKDSKRSIYLTEIFTIAYLLMTLFFVMKPLGTSKYISYIEMFIWFILSLIIFIKNGFPKDNKYFKKLGIRYAIIYCLIYLIIIYCLGLFTGFSRTIYSHTIKNLFNNIFPILIMVTSREIIRYIICRKSNDNILSLVAITAIFSIYDIIQVLGYYTLNSAEQIFIFFCLEICSTIAKQSLFTYITCKISLVPTIILSLVLELFIFIVPIFPNLGNYINSVLGILLPYFLYIKMRTMVKYSDKKEIKNNNGKIFLMFIILIIIIIFILISGIGKYKMIAIGSNSMNPIYYRGDAVIYEKINASNIKKEDILVFNSNGKIITHRVVDIIKMGNKVYFQTKGDNNNSEDIELVKENLIYGRVKYIVKYIGYPTIIIQEKLKG